MSPVGNAPVRRYCESFQDCLLFVMSHASRKTAAPAAARGMDRQPFANSICPVAVKVGFSDLAFLQKVTRTASPSPG